MNVTQSNISCGVRQLYSLHADPDDNLADLGHYLYDTDNVWNNAAFIVWSDRWGRNRSGNKLYHRIKKLFPKSHIQRTRKAYNPSSGHNICVYTWQLPKGFKRWWGKNYETIVPETYVGEYNGGGWQQWYG